MGTVTVLHTADWQIGKPFARVPDAEKRAIIRQSRIEAISRIGKLASEAKVDIVLVAGDLFDSPTISKSVVSAACSAIGEIGVPVLVIPGNHDYGGPGCLWEQDFFLQEQKALAPNLRLLLDREAVELDHAVVFPCPLLRRHESVDPCGWLHEVDEQELDRRFGEKPRIVLAHGSVQGFDSSDGQDSAPNLIALDRIPSYFDYIALGDWHGTKQIDARSWYAGTPEPDRFAKGDQHEAGHALIVECERRQSPKVEKKKTAGLGWHLLEFSFSSPEDFDQLEGKGEELWENRVGKDLLHFQIKGSLDFTTREKLNRLIESWESRLLRIKLFDHTTVLPSDDELQSLIHRAGDPLIARVAEKLRSKSEMGEAEDRKLASIALQELHQIVHHLQPDPISDPDPEKGHETEMLVQNRENELF